MTSVLVTALCNQPDAFASDLSDNLSSYLLVLVEKAKSQSVPGLGLGLLLFDFVYDNGFVFDVGLNL